MWLEVREFLMLPLQGEKAKLRAAGTPFAWTMNSDPYRWKLIAIRVTSQCDDECAALNVLYLQSGPKRLISDINTNTDPRNRASR